MKHATLRSHAAVAALCLLVSARSLAALELGPEDASGSWIGIYDNVKMGANLRGVGDVDGDGYGDFLVVGYAYNTSGTGTVAERHAMRLLLGGPGPIAANVPITEAMAASFLGRAASTNGIPLLVHSGRGGDINSDGIDDMLMAADGPTAYAYVVYGRSDAAWGTNFDLDSAADVKIMNHSDAQASRVSGDVDFNGDGIDDFFVRDGTYSPGYHGGQTPPVVHSFEIPSSPNGFAHWCVGVGDFDGNGLADLVGGEFSGQFNLRVRLHGKYIGLTGWSGNLSGNSAGLFARERGDFDGDGFDEMLYSNWNGSDGLIFGRSNIATDMQSAPALAQAAWLDGDPDLRLGYAAQWLGDINGDGCDDVIAWQGPQTDPSGGLTANDHAYVVLGSAQRPTDPQAIEDAAIRIGPFQGFVWLREFVSATDWNGDGLMDILVGAGGEDNGDIPNAGKVFIYLAGDYPAATWFNHVQRDIPAPTPGLDFGPTRVVATVSDNVTPRKLRVAYTDRAPAVGALDRTWKLELDGAPLSLLGFGYTDAQVADAGVAEADLQLINATSEDGPWQIVAASRRLGANFFDLAPAPSGLGPWWAIAAVDAAPEHWIVE